MTDRPTNVDWLESFEPWPEADIHVEWGLAGASLAAAREDLVVLVDVLSFSTTLSIACGRGATVIVYSPAELAAMGGRDKAARDLDAQVISKSRQFSEKTFSLAPSSLMNCPAGLRLIVTSLNGANCVAAASSDRGSIIGCLRNRTATAEYLAGELQNGSNSIARVTIVPSGEQWSSTSQETGWRPCVEDWLGAGAIVELLQQRGFPLSVEAELAMSSFQSVSDRLPEVLLESVSGRELVSKTFTEDVKLAAQLDAESIAVVQRDAAKREFRGIVVPNPSSRA